MILKEPPSWRDYFHNCHFKHKYLNYICPHAFFINDVKFFFSGRNLQLAIFQLCYQTITVHAFHFFKEKCFTASNKTYWLPVYMQFRLMFVCFSLPPDSIINLLYFILDLTYKRWHKWVTFLTFRYPQICRSRTK